MGNKDAFKLDFDRIICSYILMDFIFLKLYNAINK